MSGSGKLGAGALIVTPTYNERFNLPLFLRATLEVVPGAHILVVDDASPDGTGDVADAIARGDSRVRVLHRSAKLGLGTFPAMSQPEFAAFIARERERWRVTVERAKIRASQ